MSDHSAGRSPAVAVLLALTAAVSAAAAQAPAGRAADVADSAPPTVRVAGTPGAMAARPQPCRTRPLDGVRRRIVDIAAQEWGFFGFPVRDEAVLAAALRAARAAQDGAAPGWDEDGFRRSFFPRLNVEEAGRVATSVAGYWAVTPEAGMMIGRQNESWEGADGADGPRRADPWSAAFVSWVMCEAGLGDAARFQRAIAHHVYIDQAIRARQGSAPQAAYVAYDAGEAAIAPGDLLCAARRPVYRSLAERRRQMGAGARTHCDIVVRIDEPGARISAIGGNVGRAVSLKLLQAARGARGHLQPASLDEGRPVFAHLKLRAAPIGPRALDDSPTVRARGYFIAE